MFLLLVPDHLSIVLHLLFQDDLPEFLDLYLFFEGLSTWIIFFPSSM